MGKCTWVQDTLGKLKFEEFVVGECHSLRTSSLRIRWNWLTDLEQPKVENKAPEEDNSESR